MKSCTVVLAMLFLIILTINAQHDVMYFWKDGVIINEQSIREDDVDSITFYLPVSNLMVNLFAFPEQGGDVLGAGVYEPGEELLIIAMPNPSYVFVNWTGDINHLADPNSTSSTLIMPIHEIGLTANFNKVEEFTFGEVTNPETGQTWMDRNLGASRVAISISDSDAYGDLYQWGRGTDGHEKRTSAMSTTLSVNDVPGHGNFIVNGNSPKNWRSPPSGVLWQGVNGTNNPCPDGYRLPTDAEWEAERESWSSNNSEGGFSSPLKLTAAGVRRHYDGSFSNMEFHGVYWSSTIFDIYARTLYVTISAGYMSNDSRAGGRSVRCIKD